MFRYVQFLKDYHSHKKNDLGLYPENICEDLIEQKIAKYYKPKKTRGV